ncbi:MAG TPA: NAD-dependent epimerase/dehydratase family protein [Ensifer sp.]|nr:NAD-dependent epimerase/dehydratase family protein [Ensifer sp.]
MVDELPSTKTILLTGATGFLGGWLVSSFLDRGDRVVAVLNPGSSIRKNDLAQYYMRGFDKRCEEARIDLLDATAVESLIAKVRPDVVIHLAAVGDVTLAAQNPALTFDVSARSTLNLLEGLRRSSPQTLFISHTTDKVYSGNAIPFTEGMPLKPSHIYEVAKVAQEHLTATYATQYGLKTVTVRCGNYFGGYDFNFNRIIPFAIKQLLEGQPVTLRSSGRFTRDFLYIEDAVLVNLMLIDRFLEGKEGFGEAFNFSLEANLNMLELIARIGSLMGVEPEIVINDTAKSEIPDMQLSCAKARNVLGWRPAFSFDEGLQKTIVAYRDYLKA